MLDPARLLLPTGLVSLSHGLIEDLEILLIESLQLPELLEDAVDLELDLAWDRLLIGHAIAAVAHLYGKVPLLAGRGAESLDEDFSPVLTVTYRRMPSIGSVTMLRDTVSSGGDGTVRAILVAVVEEGPDRLP